MRIHSTQGTPLQVGGRSRKPFVLPQQDLTFDDSYMRLYQLPELTRNTMPIHGEPLARLLRHPAAGPSPSPAPRPRPPALLPRRPTTR